MNETWKQWTGQVVNGEFPLRQYLGGPHQRPVFLTELRGRGHQKAAIKLIPADPRNAELQLSRWRQVAKLSHPHLIRIFDMGRCQLGDRRLLYVVTEYAEEDLSQILPHRPLTPAEAGEMLKAVLEALAYLRIKGLVHGHVKPANIMALGDQVKLSSDGIFPMGQSGGGWDKPGGYDPPETASGSVSSAGDVWSLGMTLVEALTQCLPVWEKPGQAEPVLPATLPAPFLDLARNCLCRDPQRRWTVAQMRAWLQPTSSVPQPEKQAPSKRATAKPQVFARWQYIAPIAAVGLALAAIFAGPRLNRRSQAQRAAEIASEQQRVQPKPEQSSRGEKKGSGVTAPSLTSFGSRAGAKTPKGEFVQGEVFKKVLPDVPQKARDTIRGTVRVSVRIAVNPLGSVVDATLHSPGPSKYFANLALQASRRWEFWAPKVDGQHVSSEWILRFEFTQTATKAFPLQAAP